MPVRPDPGSFSSPSASFHLLRWRRSQGGCPAPRSGQPCAGTRKQVAEVALPTAQHPSPPCPTHRLHLRVAAHHRERRSGCHSHRPPAHGKCSLGPQTQPAEWAPPLTDEGAEAQRFWVACPRPQGMDGRATVCSQAPWAPSLRVSPLSLSAAPLGGAPAPYPCRQSLSVRVGRQGRRWHRAPCPGLLSVQGLSDSGAAQPVLARILEPVAGLTGCGLDEVPRGLPPSAWGRAEGCTDVTPACSLGKTPRLSGHYLGLG